MPKQSKTTKRAKREPVSHMRTADRWMSLHRDSGQAYVMLDGRRHYVGRVFDHDGHVVEMTVENARRKLAEHKVAGGPVLEA